MGQRSGTGQVCGGKELHGDVGVGQAAHGIEARGQHKADLFLRHARWLDASDVHQLSQAQALGVAQRVQAALQQVAHVGHLGGHVGHDAQSYQIEQPICPVGPTGASQESLRQFVGHADAWQFTQGMVQRQTFRINHGTGRGQRRGQVVVVGDDDVNPTRGCVGHRRVFRDASIAGEDEAGASVQHPLQRRAPDAVGLAGAHRDVVHHVRAQRLQR